MMITINHADDDDDDDEDFALLGYRVNHQHDNNNNKCILLNIDFFFERTGTPIVTTS